MGLIIEGSQSSFVLSVSENLFQKITSNEKAEIILLVFKDGNVELSIFICSAEYPKFFELRKITSIVEFEQEIEKAAGNKAYSERLFYDYIQKNDLKYDQKTIHISLDD